MESKLHENLYFVEIVNIDAITGGLTFKMHGQVGLLWRYSIKLINKVINPLSFI
jgi:hypothetical protein